VRAPATRGCSPGTDRAVRVDPMMFRGVVRPGSAVHAVRARLPRWAPIPCSSSRHTSLVSQASQAGYPDIEPSWWTPPFLTTVEVVDSVNVGGWIA
jgi:hypothetical protein